MMPAGVTALVLHPHPAAAPRAVGGVTARIDTRDPRWLCLRWRIEPGASLLIAPLAGRTRADGLWRATCFELFVGQADAPGYSEFNFSPSERWAAYDFTGYRAGMAERPLPRAPVCDLRPGNAFALFDAALPRSALPPPPWRLALSAVIVEEDGTSSYWALAHPTAAPDFHDAAGFVGRIAAIDGGG